MGLRARDPTTLFVDVGGVVADAKTVDALARLALIARRHECQAQLCHASEELRELIEFAGLSDVLGPAPLTPRSRAPRC
jgi:STAS domain